MAQHPPNRPLIYGEVLFDVFPDGTEALGGAPFNVAWNLRGFGLSPLFISRVGKDERGERVRDAMREWGLDAGGLQVDPDRPTGTVRVSLQNGQPAFSILPDQAYDFIDVSSATGSVRAGPFSIFYHGTLIARSDKSRATLNALLKTAELPVFVDVNLRSPWWNRGVVLRLVSGADWVKLNEEELVSLVGDPSSRAPSDPISMAREFFGRCSPRVLIVTAGPGGAAILTKDSADRMRPVETGEVVDTVGAGDAFSAVSILGMILNWPMATTLHRAVTFAAGICRIRGATLGDRSVFESFRSEWGIRP